MTLKYSSPDKKNPLKTKKFYSPIPKNQIDTAKPRCHSQNSQTKHLLLNKTSPPSQSPILETA